MFESHQPEGTYGVGFISEEDLKFLEPELRWEKQMYVQMCMEDRSTWLLFAESWLSASESLGLFLNH